MKIRKMLLLLILMVLCLLFLPSKAEATTVASGTCGADGDNLTWTLDDAGTLTISGTGDSGYYLGHPVPWDSQRDIVKTVVVQDGVSGIGVAIFSGHSNLRSITLPGSVTYIAMYAFSGCSSLTSITIPDGVTSIGPGAFQSCSSLTSITIPDSVTGIGGWVFSGCDSLQYNIYDNAQYLGNTTNPYYALISTVSDSITFCEIQKNTRIIADSAFNGCSSLASITIPNGVAGIGGSAFYGCDSLTNITIPASVTSISSYAFNYCDNLSGIWVDADNPVYSSDDSGVLFNKDKTILIKAPRTLSGAYSIPDGVIRVDDSAFEECSSLTTIEIPDGTISVGYSAFSGCSSLTSITIPDSVTDISGSAFSGCDSLQYNIYDNAQYLGNTTNPYHLLICNVSESITTCAIHKDAKIIVDSAFDGCVSLASITIPDGVTGIGSYAFYGCSSLTSITIPASVTSISSYAFDYCDNLSGIWVDADNPVYSSDDSGVLFNKDKTIFLQVPRALSGVYSVPDSVTSIDDSAFSGCDSLSSIAIPDSVTSIGEYAFSYCDSLTSITLPSGLTSIAARTFYDCGNLANITIPSGVSSIGDYAFYSCDSLTNITIPDSVTSIGDYAFSYCNITNLTLSNRITIIADGVFCKTSLTNIIIPDNVTSIGGSAFYGCDSLTSIMIPDSVTSIGDNAFNGCRSLASVAIPDSVISIGNGAFAVCTSLTSITIPDSVISIGDSAFEWCTGLTGAVIGNRVTSIGDNAFSWCSSLTTIAIGNSVISIGDSAFDACRSLTTIAIGNSVTSIGDYAFFECSNLTSITIPGGVTNIGDYAFAVCTSLTYVYYDGTAEQWAAVSVGGWNDALLNANIIYLEDKILVVTSNGQKKSVSSLDQAFSLAAGGYIQLCDDVTESVTVSASGYLDLNGYTLTGDITIADGATLYVFDSATADYTAANRGKLLGRITGNLARSFNTPTAYGHNYKYLALEEEDGVWSFHRYYLTVKSVVLRPYISGKGYTGTAVDYKTHFKCNELVAQYVTAYGTKLVGDNTVYSDYMANGYSLLTGAENTNEQCTWLTGTCKTTNSAEVNATNALRKPTVSAYITLVDDAEITSAGVQRSLQDMIVYANGLTDLTTVEKKALGKMYNLFEGVLDTWAVDITNIKRFAAELA